MVGLAALLNDRSYQVEVLTYHNTPFYESFLAEHHVRHRCVQRPRCIIGLIWRIRKSFKSIHPDVVISYLDSPNILACLAKILGLNFKLIVSERNTTQRISKRDKLKFFLYQWADSVIPNSYSQERFIMNHYPNLRNKVKVITNYVDLGIFHPALHKKEKNCLHIIGVGRVEAQKNIGCLIKAVKSVVDQGFEIRVSWYGRQTNLLDEYEAMLQKMRLEKTFKFYEPTIVIHEKYQESDLFCLPSLYEGYPNVLCEAMACGLPVICSDVCDNPDIMAEGVNGYLFNPHDPHDLATQIVRFATSSVEARELMGRKSRELAEEKFNKEKCINIYLKLIN